MQIAYKSSVALQLTSVTCQVKLVFRNALTLPVVTLTSGAIIPVVVVIRFAKS